jgi:hypothetical protein
MFVPLVSSRPTLTRCCGTFTSFLLGKREGEPSNLTVCLDSAENIWEVGRVSGEVVLPIARYN